MRLVATVIGFYDSKMMAISSDKFEVEALLSGHP